MILGLNTFALNVFAYTESIQFSTWTEVCNRHKTIWIKIPTGPSTIHRCSDDR